MENLELVLLKPRARRLPEQVYVAAIAVAGTETSITPQILVYSNNIGALQQLVNDHNEMVKVRKAAAKAKK